MKDLYQEITDRIMEQLENGIIPWQKPWVSSGSAVSYATGKPYSLLNQMLLGRPGEYATFRQIQQSHSRSFLHHYNLYIYHKVLQILSNVYPNQRLLFLRNYDMRNIRLLRRK